MDCQGIIKHISEWLDAYACDAGIAGGFVVGVSGGVDSAVTSTLAAMTGRPTLCMTLPIHQAPEQVSRAKEHIDWLKERHPNVSWLDIDLTAAFGSFVSSFPAGGQHESHCLASANTRSRMRMTALYHMAALRRALVVGTGNKIEDHAIGFFTKYGDGGVDVSPIGELTKTEVYALAEALGLPASIRNAPPTDGLFGDDRTDEQQIGASYPELEWAMEASLGGARPEDFCGRRREVMEIYRLRHDANRHKMEPIPVCRVPRGLKYKI